MYGDVPAQELLDFHYRVLDYKNEGSLAQIPQTGLSSDYVLRETKRARAGLDGHKDTALARNRHRHPDGGEP